MTRARDHLSPHGEALSKFAPQLDRPVVIGGCPRSGTTLLRTMLHCHPEIAIPRETRFVLESWLQRTKFGDLEDVANRRRLASWIFERKESQANRLGLDEEEAIERLVAAPPTLGSLLATCFVMYAERNGKPRWGDKRPMYATRLSAIWDLFPNAQFIHVVRDPRACVASVRKLGWYNGKVAPALELWERSIHTVNAWRPKLSADQLLEVKYEDLVTAPEATRRLPGSPPSPGWPPMTTHSSKCSGMTSSRKRAASATMPTSRVRLIQLDCPGGPRR